MGFVDIEDVATGAIIQGTWRTLADRPIHCIERQASDNYCFAACKIRHQLELYFNGIGSVSWKNERVLLH